MISVVWCSFYVRLFYFVRLFNYSLMRRCICIYFNFFYLLFLFQKNENKNVYLFYYFGFAFVHRCNHFNNWVRWLLFFFPSFSRCHQYADNALRSGRDSKNMRIDQNHKYNQIHRRTIIMMRRVFISVVRPIFIVQIHQNVTSSMIILPLAVVWFDGSRKGSRSKIIAK